MKLYQKNYLKTIIEFDSETMPNVENFSDLSEKKQNIWLTKYHSKFLLKEIESRKEKQFLKLVAKGTCSYQTASEVPMNDLISANEIYQRYSPLIAEFGRVFCISIGLFEEDEETGELQMNVTTICEDEEKETISTFFDFLDSSQMRGYILGGYNISGFDIPFITKRALILGLDLPKPFQLLGKKPWEINMADLALDWKGTQWEMTSLASVCLALDVESPKTEFNNDEVVPLYLAGKITKQQVCDYCERDVYAPMKVRLKLCSETSKKSVKV